LTLVGLMGAAPRARCGVARGGACAQGTRWGGAVVLLDGGSSWSAPGCAALLEPPAVAAAAAAAHCAGSSPLRGSGGDIVAGGIMSYLFLDGR